MNLPEFYASIGGSPDDALRRFGGEALLVKYLHKLPGDQTFAALGAAMARSAPGEAFRAAHTLKGIALTLSLAPLIQASGQLTELLRGADQISGEASVSFAALSSVYRSILAQLGQLEDGDRRC